MTKKNIAILIAVGLASAGLTVGAIELGLSIAGADKQAARALEWSAPAPISTPAPAPAITFYAAWVGAGGGSALPALQSNPAAIAADGKLELIFMFDNEEGKADPIVEAYVAMDAAGENRIAELACNQAMDASGGLFACNSPLFDAVTAIESGAYYGIVVSVGSDGRETTVSGVAYTRRLTPSAR